MSAGEELCWEAAGASLTKESRQQISRNEREVCGEGSSSRLLISRTGVHWAVSDPAFLKRHGLTNANSEENTPNSQSCRKHEARGKPDITELVGKGGEMPSRK